MLGHRVFFFSSLPTCLKSLPLSASQQFGKKANAMNISNSIPFIKQVLVYKGHEKHPLLGPYADKIHKRIAIFDLLNQYRAVAKKPLWRVRTVAGEQLVE